MGVYRILAIFTCLFCSPAFGTTTTLSIWLDNQTYSLALEEHLPAGMQSAPENSTHYKGSIVGVENSWARISRIDYQWEGIVSLNEELYIIDLAVLAKSSRALQTTVITAQPASSYENMGSCGMHSSHGSDTESVSAISLKSRTVQEAAFSSLCTTTVDGICLLAEIDFVFDQSFQSMYPTTYESRAVELINIVEGYYRNDLNIGFETLSTTFLSSDVFTTSTNSLTVLQDVSAKKDNGTISFSSKDEALMQLITGRDFDGTTVGVAWLEGLCDSSGYWSTSTAQVVSNIPLTALVSAHEIGHNLGAGHDGTGNSCGSGFIMAPSLSSFASSFSTCSVNYIQSAISGVSNQDSCFNYPFDIEISDLNGSNSVSTSTTTRTYRIDAAFASESITQSILTGSISSGTGSITAASIDSNNCSVAGNGQSYSCTLVTPSSNHQLAINLSVADGNYTLSHNVAVSQTDLSETDTSNNTLTDNFNVSVSGDVDPDPIEPEAEPPAEDIDEPVQETQSSDTSQSTPARSSSNSSSSSGGGGSMGTLAFALFSLLFIRRRIASKLG